MNIRTRLTLLFALLVTSIMLLFSISIYYLYNQYREYEFSLRLRDKALTTAHLVDNVNDLTEEVLRELDRNDLTALYRGHVTIYGAQNKPIYNSPGPAIPVSDAFLNQIRKGQSILLQREQTEILGLPYRNNRRETLVVVASAIDHYGFNKLQRLREILILGWLASLVVLLLAGWFFAGDALKPVSDIINQVNTISATNIHARLNVGRSRDELASLATTFNEMLNRLEEAFVSQKNFVSHASHELRTPLTVITGQIEVTRMQTRSREEYERTLDDILVEVRKMNHLVNGLLDLAYANADIAMMSLKPVRIDELLWQARTALLRNHPDYEVTITYDALPEQEEDLMLRGEETLLRTAFQNLMDNGCKYSTDHQVSVALKTQPEGLELRFSDNGPGVTAEEVPSIFEPFYRSQQSTDLGISGHGIGLALTRRIVELHQGTIQVQSQPGQPTTFLVQLPNQTTGLSGTARPLPDQAGSAASYERFN